MILLDNRVGSKELAPYIHTKHRLTRLEYADAFFTGSGPDNTPALVGIERKTIGDLVSSISSGRLSGHQLIGLLDSFTYIYILVEGIWQPNRKTGILEKLKGKKWVTVSHGKQKFMARDVWNYLNTLSVMCSVHVVTTSTIQQSGYWIDSTYGWWQKPFDKHRSHLQFQNQPSPTSSSTKTMKLRLPTSFERIAVGISGIGWTQAALLNKHFKTPLELAMASKEELMLIKGIGEKTARTIIREMSNEDV